MADQVTGNWGVGKINGNSSRRVIPQSARSFPDSRIAVWNVVRNFRRDSPNGITAFWDQVKPIPQRRSPDSIVHFPPLLATYMRPGDRCFGIRDIEATAEPFAGTFAFFSGHAIDIDWIEHGKFDQTPVLFIDMRHSLASAIRDAALARREISEEPQILFGATESPYLTVLDRSEEHILEIPEDDLPGRVIERTPATSL